MYLTFHGSSNAENLQFPVSSLREGEEEEYIPKILSTPTILLTDKVLHENVHLVDTSNTSEITPSTAWPTDFANHDSRLLCQARGKNDVVILKKAVRPIRSICDCYASEKGVDVGHEDVDARDHVYLPIGTEVRGPYGEIDL